MLAESRFGWAVFAGIPNNDNSILAWILATGVAVNLIYAYTARKIRIHKKIIPAKVKAHPPSGRVNWRERKRGGMGGENVS